MQFKVPQFLDIEDKIFGPFTFREFIYLAGGAGLCFVLYRLLGFYLGAIPILAMAALALALTFYKPNNKPFINMIEAGLKYMTQDKLYVWKKPEVRLSTKEQNKVVSEEKGIPKPNEEMRLSGSKLRDLAWSLDVMDLNQHADK